MKDEKPRDEKAQKLKNYFEISYNTRLTIVVLLLLFVYPVGLIFMWIWMRYWPLWLKILISLPLALVLIALIFVVTIILIIFKRATTDKTMREKMYRYQHQMSVHQLAPRLSPSDA